MGTFVWTYRYTVGTTTHYFNAANRKEADALAAQHGIARTAFTGRS